MKKKFLSILVVAVIMITAAVAVPMFTADSSADSGGDYDINDALNILKYLAKIVEFDEFETAEYDINGNGVIDINDALEILRALAKLSPMPTRPEVTTVATVTVTESASVSATASDGTAKTPSPTSTSTTTSATTTSATTTSATTTSATTTSATTTTAQSTQPIEYNITMNFNGGEPILPGVLTTVNKKLTNIPTPTRENYTFDGWWTTPPGGNGVKVMPDTEFTYSSQIYARWTAVELPTSFTITFVSSSPNMSSITVIDTRYTDANGRLTEPLPTPSLPGLRFNGWFISMPGDNIRVIWGTGSNATVFTEDTTVEAAWLTTTVTFDTDGGVLAPGTPSTAVVSTVDGKLASLPTPIRPGYDFVGWYTTQTGTTEVTTDRVYTANTTIYARWKSATPNTFTITLVSNNGGTQTPSVLATGTDGRLATLPTPSTTGTGAMFTGWYLTQGFYSPGSPGEVKGGVNGTVFTEDTTIYASFQFIPPDMF
ncbi:MAG: InlB B-repeat-containing protein [Oscillospiraceae bacterium]|nr:InlB B-repeat-containing protein [Oscillospiraceae bacterium]